MSEKPYLIGLAGKAGSGKNTVGDILRSLYGYNQLAFADALKAQLVALDPWVAVYGARPYKLSELDVSLEEAKVRYPEVRRLLQRLGTEAGRDLLGDDTWVERAFAVMDAAGPVATWVITDVRFPNEVDAIHAAGGVVFRVVRDDGHNLGDNEVHVSERALDNYDLPLIDNSGDLRDLEAEVFLQLAATFGSEMAWTSRVTGISPIEIDDLGGLPG